MRSPPNEKENVFKEETSKPEVFPWHVMFYMYSLKFWIYNTFTIHYFQKAVSKVKFISKETSDLMESDGFPISAPAAEDNNESTSQIINELDIEQLKSPSPKQIKSDDGCDQQNTTETNNTKHGNLKNDKECIESDNSLSREVNSSNLKDQSMGERTAGGNSTGEVKDNNPDMNIHKLVAEQIQKTFKGVDQGQEADQTKEEASSPLGPVVEESLKLEVNQQPEDTQGVNEAIKQDVLSDMKNGNFADIVIRILQKRRAVIVIYGLLPSLSK